MKPLPILSFILLLPGCFGALAWISPADETRRLFRQGSCLLPETAYAEDRAPGQLAEILERMRTADPESRLSIAAQLRTTVPLGSERIEAQTALLRILRDAPLNDQILALELARVLDAWGVDLTNVLVHALTDDDQVLTFALSRALKERGGISTQRMAKELDPLLHDRRVEVRLRTVETIGMLGLRDPRILASLRAALKDKDRRVRFRTATALRRIGDRSPETLAAARLALHDDSENVAARAAGILGDAGGAARDAIPELTATRDQAKPALRGEVDKALKKIADAAPDETGNTSDEPRELFSAAHRGLSAPVPTAAPAAPDVAPPDVKPTEARAALVSPRAPEPVPDETSLLMGLRAPTSEDRAAAALQAAGTEKPSRLLLAELGRAIRDQDPSVRFAAGYALSRSGDAGVLPLSDAAGDVDPRVRLNAVQALGLLQRTSPEATNVIEGLLQREDDLAVRIQAALAILEINARHEVAIRTLVAGLPAVNDHVRPRLISALRLAPIEQVVPKLFEATKDQEALMRREALLALRNIAPRAQETADASRALLKDPEELVRRAAAEGRSGQTLH